MAVAAAVTVVDDNGADDEPGQKDLNSLSVDYNPGNAFDIVITWHWDDTAWSGQNSGDAEALFDTDGDGNANFTLAVEVSGTPAEYVNTRLYRCADSRSDRCQSPNDLVAEDTNGDETLDSPVAKASTGAASVVANSDPFGVASSPFYTPAHADSNDCTARHRGCPTDDTVVTVNVKLADFGAASAKLINVCSFPSGQPVDPIQRIVSSPPRAAC